MSSIATSLANAGITFKIKKQYTIEFTNSKPELEEMKEEAESLVRKFGDELVIFSN